jgi:hypothetical protein
LVVAMDLLKYFFHIDPVRTEREKGRRRKRQAKKRPRIMAVRYIYVNAQLPQTLRKAFSTIEEETSV